VAQGDQAVHDESSGLSCRAEHHNPHGLTVAAGRRQREWAPLPFC
jgi:hypothetical protein